ncbi:MAG: pro-sigmaK processing inhibitor BofA family protein [Clostridia bacterium]|nr:pro-sigmaK processing inhibitor BofA family protein [Clostridia bacterium]
MTEYIVLIFAAIAVVIVAKMLAWPVKKIIKLAVNVVLGIIMIYLVNTFGMVVGIKIPFNIVTALIAGILGVPGVVALILIGFFI